MAQEAIQGNTTGQPHQPEPDGQFLLERLRKVLRYFVGLMKEMFVNRAKEYEAEQPEYANELYACAELYQRQALEAIEMIHSGEFTLQELKQVTSILYVTNLTLRWILEQQTDTYQKLLNSPTPVLGQKIEQARYKIDTGDEDNGFDELLSLVSSNRNHYPLLMTMGFVYLKNKKNLNYAMRYFEKAAQSNPPLEPQHYKNLALSFLATCHEGKKHIKNALNTLLQADRAGNPDSPVLFDIARYYGQLGNSRKAMDYFDRAIRQRPEFMALALSDDSFDPVSESFNQNIQKHFTGFKSVADEFLALVTPIMEAIEKHKLEKMNKELERTVRVTRFNIAMIKKGHYSGYRLGMVGFFRGAFPEIIFDTSNSLLKRRLVLKEEIEEYNENLKKQTKSNKLIMTPIVALVVGAGSYYVMPNILPQLQAVLPVTIPFLDIIIPGILAVVAGIVGLSMLSGRMKKRWRDLSQADTLLTKANAIRALEAPLRSLWQNKIMKEIDEAPLMDEDTEV